MKRSAAVIAVCVALSAGAVALMVLGERADRLLGVVKLGHPLAAAVPMDLGGWHGSDEPLKPHELELIQMDDCVRRRYQHDDGSNVLLYVAYHGNKQRGMNTYFHNATVCFPSQGWVQESEKTSNETLHDLAKEVPVCRYVFAKEGARLSVMTFFQVDGELLDQSPRNKPFWSFFSKAADKFSDSPGTFVQVQVITPVANGDVFAASDRQSRFLREFGRDLFRAVEVGAGE